MKEIILIKYGDLVLKKGNRNFFIKTLRDNIKKKLEGIEYTIRDDQTRMFIHTSDIEECRKRLKEVFGIYEIVSCAEIESREVEVIEKCILESIKDINFKTFKVNTKRSDKSYPIKSTEFNNIIGSLILKNIPNVRVDVHSPELEIVIEIRNKFTYIYSKVTKGLGGYPVGSLGKGLLMLSGGIDSPVAGYLSIKKGVKLDYIYFESLPHTSMEARNKVINLAKILEKYNNNGKLYVINFTKIQETIYKNLKPDYLITFMRRMMYRIAVNIASKNKHLAIFNGESIGQVASQTLSSIKAVNDVTNYPIFRPLASFDKQEIIGISKSIGAYDISIEPYEDCCTVFVPEHPVINPSLDIIYAEEEKIDFSDLIKEAVNTALIVNLKEENEMSEYL